MSKSEGNTVTIRDVLDEWGAETFLLFMMTGHWRRPIEFSQETMTQAAARAATFQNAFLLDEAPVDEDQWADFLVALNDDFDTPLALTVMHRWASEQQLELLRRALDVFGLMSLSRRPDVPANVLALREQRDVARRNQDFAQGDLLRRELEAAGGKFVTASMGRHSCYLADPRPVRSISARSWTPTVAPSAGAIGSTANRHHLGELV